MVRVSLDLASLARCPQVNHPIWQLKFKYQKYQTKPNQIKKKKTRKTYISRNTPYPPRAAQPVLVLVRHEPSKHGVDVQRLLVGGQVVQAEPQAGGLVGRVQVDLVADVAVAGRAVGFLEALGREKDGLLVCL